LHFLLLNWTEPDLCITSHNQLSDDGDEQEENEEATEVSDGSGIPLPAEQLIHEIADEM